MDSGIELRLLRYVVAIADELHFSRAARKLHVSQPTLSKQIIALEKHIGIRLFDRTKREVHITGAGEVFVREARETLLHSQRVVHLTRAKHQPASFTLGYSPYADLSVVGEVRAMSASVFAGVHLKLVSAVTSVQLERIHTGEVGAALVVLPVVPKGIITQPVSREPLRAVLPVDHELASRSEVSLHQLCDMPLICIGRQHHPKFYKQLHEICLRHGLDAVANQDVTTFSEAAPMVAEGLGFTFARAWPERHSYSGIVFRAIKGCPLAVDSALAFRQISPSGVLDRLIVALGERELARTDVPMSGHESQMQINFA